MSSGTSQIPAARPRRSGSYLYYRHALPVRLMHWINVVALTILLLSGLNIFSAHPALYWGKSSYTGRGPVFQIGAREDDGGNAVGVTHIFGRDFVTTGFLGASTTSDGEVIERTFPAWLTIPDSRWLAMARRWHFFFAWVFVINGLCYVAYSIGSRHLARDLAPDRTDWRSIGRSIVDHLRLKHPVGEAAKRYNVLQKLTYLTVIFLLLPLTILMGMAMSPWLDGLLPGWVDLVGGRQSARTLHFIAAWLIVAFVLIHVVEAIIAGFWNELRSMISGRYRVETEAIDETAR
ncbi:MAG TPA: cytochrome b/b6 domain-containing protein [Casimicrobiaceae bacterium]|nr:cytochrome b/b6 domain-containing protein [Casimicrobiaceae bacterium]